MDRTQTLATVATLAAAGSIDMLAHLGPTGLVIGGIAAYVAYRHAPDVLGHLPEEVPALPSFVPVREPGSRSIADRLLGRFPEEETIPVEALGTNEPEYFDEEYSDEDELEVWNPRPRVNTFSSMLTTFTPSLGAIYLATLPDGTAVYSDVKGLCHVALAGTTGNGKSSLIRLLMSQLCKAGASVLLLNPHYTRYDVEQQEDWTPFEPYLVHDPMECRKYEVIEHYLKQVATVLLPKRLEKYAHSQPLGKPYFLVIDELPAIVKHVKGTPDYLASILQEGRKVGIYLITSAQDFLVKTIAPQGGGAVRECYRTAFYVGGDQTSAKILLDVSANQIQENTLGEGAVMMRCKRVKQAQLARVPYVDNDALYRLLGPSTYTAAGALQEDDLFLENLQPQQHYTEPYYQPMPKMTPNPYREVPRPEPEVRPATGPKSQPVMSTSTSRLTPKLTPELQRVWDVYKPGMSHRELAQALAPKVKVSHVTAGKYLQRLKDLRMIGADGNYLVSR